MNAGAKKHRSSAPTLPIYWISCYFSLIFRIFYRKFIDQRKIYSRIDIEWKLKTVVVTGVRGMKGSRYCEYVDKNGK